MTVTVPFDPRYLSAPSSTYKIPAPAKIWSNIGVSNRNHALSSSERFKLAGPLESEPDITSRRRPLKYDNGIEAFLIGAYCGSATIDLEPVRLNGDLEFPGAGIRTRQASLDKLDIGIRVIDPDRGRAAACTCLLDTQHGLVIFRVRGAYLQDRRCRVKVTIIRRYNEGTLV